MPEKKIIIFCDGASKGNPGPGGFGAVIVLPIGKVEETGGREEHTTNNKMELTGAAKALEKIKDRKEEIEVYTDSKYLINGITNWVYSWQKNNWRTKDKRDVLNRELWETLVNLIKDKKIQWHYVGGHVGIAGNERCDEIASGFATGEKIVLYKGPLSHYKINVLDFGHNEKKKENKYSKSAKAYSYLSLVNGVLKIDKTWAECENRVKGKKGAKYQKAISEFHEKEILSKWGSNE